MRFRYSITSGENLSREQLARFDADTRAPVLAYPFVSSFSAQVTGMDRPLPTASGSFLALDADNLQIVVLKAAEDGRGMILRLHETAGRSGEATLTVPCMNLKSAHLCNGVEVNRQKLEVENGSITLPYQSNRFVTVRLEGESGLTLMANQ